MAIDIFTILLGVALCVGTYLVKDDIIQMIGTMAVFIFLLVVVPNRPAFALTALAALLLFHSTLWNTHKKLIDLDRNYFGVIKVYEQKDYHFFFHGTTMHGAQSMKKEWEKRPVTYYSPGGPAWDSFQLLSRHAGRQRVAVLGLGVGSVACYAQKERSFDFYEIDPDVVQVAENPEYFTFLSGCGSPYKVILGDARLKIKDAPDHSYDMIFIDVFSSDNIPVHIMTKEAFETYERKLAPNGIIAINISNRYLDLRGPLSVIARDLGMTMYYKQYTPQTKQDDISEIYVNSLFAAMAKDARTIAPLAEDREWKPYEIKHGDRMWTDDYANILSALYLLND
jgi:hypothetical protein